MLDSLTSNWLKAGCASRNRLRTRRGAAVIEFAVCLPILVLLVFGSIEATSLIFLKQSLQTAAYEGVRQAVKQGALTAEVNGVAEEILDSRQVRDASITFPLGDIRSIGRGQLVAVEVSAPTRSNSPLAGRIIADRIFTVRAVMVKE